jgi:hypothetical protein
MEASEILKKLAQKNSIYGIGARQNMNDPFLAHKFLCECYSEINENPKTMKEHFGVDLVNEIMDYIKTAQPCE